MLDFMFLSRILFYFSNIFSEMGYEMSICAFMYRVISVLWKGVILHQNVMRQSTVGLSLVGNNHRSNSKEVLLHPLPDRRSRTISTVGVGHIPALIAVHLAQAISFPSPLVVSGCREQLGPTLSLTCHLR